jgi:signal transduction histidine kinase/ActR/RegA family two-component response regulator
MLGQPTDAENAVLVDTLRRESGGFTRRERLAELLLAGSFAIAVTGLWRIDPPHRFALLPVAICFVVLAFAMRIRIDTPFGFTVPTQLAFIPLLFALPVALVPLAVVAAAVITRLPEVLAHEVAPVRLGLAIGNSWYAVGPVAVFALARVAPDSATPLLLVGALAAQIAVDFSTSAARFAIARSAAIKEQIAESWVYVVDVALSGVGLLVAEEIHRAPIAALAPIPLLGLVALFARERNQRLNSLIELNDAYRHARDEAVEASKLKSAFLRNVSHEIRTPMNGVMGMNDLLRDTDLNSEQRYFAEQVASSSEHMLTIINDILDISKIESGRLDLDLVEFDLHDAIEQVCAPARATALDKEVWLTLDIDDTIPRRVRGDATRVRQTLLNLVTNAVKFTPSGYITVSARRCGEEAAEGIRFEVVDTGIGIDPEALDRMFEPFMQADVSTTRQYGGNGLGLSIAKELVALMGGEIGAESKPDSGSRFWFELDLPASAAATEPGHEQVVRISERRSSAAAALVLVVEDSPVNRVVAVSVLERRGYRVHVVNDGREALQALATQRYDAVLMDCQMPDIDGYEATRELRRRESGGRHTPIIAMTAHAMTGDRERCIAAGMDDYIAKPVRAQALEEILERWIGTADFARSQPPLRTLRAG